MSCAVESEAGQSRSMVGEQPQPALSTTEKMRRDQITMLSAQNAELISSLDRAEEELGSFHREKATLAEENEALRKGNFELNAKVKSAEGRLEEVQISYDEVESNLETMTTKNTELFNLLEREEANTAKISAELEACKSDSTALGEKYTALVQSSKESEETANNALRENQLKTDEIRVLRAEVEQLKQKNSELSIQSTVELESVHEQLRLRKEKHYQLLGKLQSQEEASRRAEDHVKDMEQSVRDLRQKSSELQTALQLETNARISQDNSHRTLTIDFEATSTENKELSSKLQELEQDRLKLEAEARDNGEQLREMAEKVFQLLERLKLAELGKKKSMEALTKKEQEVFALKKQQGKVAEDCANQRRIREKVDAEKRVVEDQLRGLKKVNSQISQKLKEEAKCRIREEEACKEANEKVRTLDGRLAFLLNRLQTDEEARSVQQDEIKKMESQLQSATQRCDTLQTKLSQAEDNARDATEKLQQSDKELKDAKIKQQSMEQLMKLQEEQELKAERKAILSKGKQDHQNSLAGGQLRFFVDNRPSLGHAVVTGKCPKDKVWLEERGCNVHLRKALKSQNSQEPLVKRIAELYGAVLFGEEQLEKAQSDLKSRDEDMERFERELNVIQTDVLREEESKRRILLRYIRAVKASVSLGEPGCEEDRKEVGGVGSGRINLPEASLCDEDIAVISAMLRNNATIEELQFRKNQITDEGARAIGAILAERSALKLVDLRENSITTAGLKAIADALERSERVHKVMVEPGGKICAFGASDSINESTESTAFAVKSVCVVDVRDQSKPNEKSSTEHRKAHPKRVEKRIQGRIKRGPSSAKSAGSLPSTNKQAASRADKVSVAIKNRKSVSAPSPKRAAR